MIKRVRIVFSFILCCAFVLSLGGVPQAQAAPVIPPQPQEYLSKNGDVTYFTLPQVDTAALARNILAGSQTVKPMDLIPVKPSDLNGSSSNFSSELPVTSGGGAPDPAAMEKAKTEFPEAWEAAKTRQSMPLPALQVPNMMDKFGTKNTYSGYIGSYYDPFWLYYPYGTVGQYYFTDVYNNLYSCTASLISGNNIIATAAHCVFNTDKGYDYYYTPLYFVPGNYGGINGVYPYGSYGVSQGVVMTKWITAKKSSSAINYDIALLSLTGNAVYYTGWLGFAVNVNTKSLQHTIGFPSNITNGTSTYICVAESFQKSADVLGMGCDMTYGASGGPWIWKFIPYLFSPQPNEQSYPLSASGDYVDAVVSSGVPGTPTFYGPRFSSKNFLPMCNANSANYWPGCY
jgi:hypothetical protein